MEAKHEGGGVEFLDGLEDLGELRGFGGVGGIEDFKSSRVECGGEPGAVGFEGGPM